MKNKIRIKRLIRETKDTITLQFERHPSLDQYSSGQFINIFKELDQQTLSRAYSFSSSPEVDVLPAVTIKRLKGGRLSGYLVDNLKQGQFVLVSDPLGRFGLNTELDDKHLIFVAGGSGITPLYSMIKTALSKSEKVFVSLVYANRDTESIIFKEQIQFLEKRYSSRFKATYFLEKNYGKGIQRSYISGYINKVELDRITNAFPERTAEVYMCGPAGMMDNISGYLDELNFSKDHRFIESFVSSNLAPKSFENEHSKMVKVTLLKNDRVIKFHMRQEEFILKSALEQGHVLPHSCKEAMCGTCKVKVISGKVKMTENYALPNGLVNDGYVLLCTTKPESAQVKLAYH